MTERQPTPVIHRSVFAKLVAVMLSMAIGLLATIGAFFSFVVTPTLDRSMERVIEEYARVVASTSPDLQTARRLGAQAQVGIRYEGPDGAWATSDDVPTIRQGDNGGTARASGIFPSRATYTVRTPQGGAYLFSWIIGRSVYDAHNRLVILLFVLVAALVFLAHVVLNRLLRPVRWLGDGVARLSAGELDVVLPTTTRDEFGVLTAAFNEMVGRVREMVSARDQLLLDVSHELRSPLTRIKVALELSPPGENRARMAADVAEMEAMISELLELERLRDGRSLKTAGHDVVPILRDIAGSFHDRAPGVAVQAPGGQALATVDPDRVRTVFRNLIENAIKYSLPDSAPVAVLVEQDDRAVTITVRDDGPGIPEADLANVFEPFFRVDRSRSKKTGGYGLGLSICRRIVEAHGGTVSARNQEPRGAVFVVTLPR